MCGRFAFFSPHEAVQEYFDLDVSLDLTPRYNITPSQEIAAVRQTLHGETEAVMLKWGLVPFWAKDPAIGNRMINARAETVAEKPAFRQAFTRRRCLILANGFYEWHKEDDGKTPYYVALKGDHPFAMAGLWEKWKKGDAAELETCTIITTSASASIAKLHHRMPVILDPDVGREWIRLDKPTDELSALLNPYDSDAIEAWPVSHAVNNPTNQGAELIEPAR